MRLTKKETDTILDVVEKVYAMFDLSDEDFDMFMDHETENFYFINVTTGKVIDYIAKEDLKLIKDVLERRKSNG